MSQNNKLFYGILIALIVVILIYIGMALFFKPTPPTPVAPNVNQTQSLISTQLDKEFQLKINQVALIESEGLKVKFLNVTEDYRCPIDVLCKTGGSVTVTVNIQKNAQNIGNYNLSNGEVDENVKSKTFDNYSIKLIKVEPDRKENVNLSPSDYMSTFIVSRAYEIKLKSRTFTPAEDIEQFFTNIKAKNIKPEDLLSGKYHGVAQFYEIPTDEKKSMLEKMGIILHDYLPNNAYTTSIDPALTIKPIATLGLIRSLFTLERNDKLSSDIISGQIGDWARQESGKVDVIVKYYPDVPNDKAQSALQTFGGQIILSSDSFQRITIRIDENKINSLADFEWVSWIEPIAPPPTTY